MKSPFYYFSLVILIFLLHEGNCQINPWHNIGPNIGSVNALAKDNANPDTMYAATPFGVYKSVDGAENWIKTSLDSIAVNFIEVCQLNPAVIVAATFSTVYLSEDYGRTWKISLTTPRPIGAIALDPSDSQSIWVGIHVVAWTDYTENLFHSDDGGDNWEAVPFVSGTHLKLEEVHSIHFDQVNDSVIYVGGLNDATAGNGMFVSKDKGNTWTGQFVGNCSRNKIYSIASAPRVSEQMDQLRKIPGHAVPDSTPEPPVPPTPQPNMEPNTFFVLRSEDCYMTKTLLKSTDFGDNWISVNIPYTNGGSAFGNTMQISSEDPNILVFTGDYLNQRQVFFYHMREDTWDNLPVTQEFSTGVVITGKTGLFLGSFDGILYYSESTSSWKRKDKGMNDVPISEIVPYPDHKKLIAISRGDLLKTNNSGKNWSVYHDNITALAINKFDTSMLFSGNNAGSVTFGSPFYCYKSENGGLNWTNKRLFTRSGLYNYWFTMWTGAIQMFPDNKDIILVGVDGGGVCGEGLYRSTDGGDTWNQAYTTGVSSIALDPVNSDIAYLGTTDLGYVSRSEDGGESWTRISPGASNSFATNIRELAVDNKHQVFATTSSGLYKWEGNENWSLVQGLPVTNTTSIVIDNHGDNPVYYVGTNGNGIYKSENGGSTWTSFNNGLVTLRISKLRMNNSNILNLYAGTYDGGVWVTTLQGIPDIVPDVHGKDISFRIFPNPARGTFNITNEGTMDVKGTLKIINLLGEVCYCDNDAEISSKKTNSVTVDNLPSGNYMLVFISDAQTVYIKIIISK